MRLVQDFDKYYASLCKQTEAAITGKLSDLIPLMPVLSEEEKAVQNKVKEIAERCMDLQADAMRRLRPEQRRPLYLVCVCVCEPFAGSIPSDFACVLDHR